MSKKRRRQRIALLALGGTIACKKTAHGLVPKLKARDLIAAISLPQGWQVDAFDPMTRTILFPADWTSLAKIILRHLATYDGFVITLGTDTLAYASSALSLALKNIPKPVVLTGAMRPLFYHASDGRNNLSNAMKLAAEKVGGVFVVFGEKIIDGSRTSKIKSEGRSAFESVNTPPPGRFVNGRVQWVAKPQWSRKPFRVRAAFDERVAVIKLTPQLAPDFIAGLSRYQGILIECYGDGNVSDNLVPPLTRLVKKRVVVLASQCPYGAVSHHYAGGIALLRSGALSARDMTKETALVKLMWALGQSQNRGRVSRLFNEKM